MSTHPASGSDTDCRPAEDFDAYRERVAAELAAERAGLVTADW